MSWHLTELKITNVQTKCGLIEKGCLRQLIGFSKSPSPRSVLSFFIARGARSVRQQRPCAFGTVTLPGAQAWIHPQDRVPCRQLGVRGGGAEATLNAPRCTRQGTTDENPRVGLYRFISHSLVTVSSSEFQGSHPREPFMKTKNVVGLVTLD